MFIQRIDKYPRKHISEETYFLITDIHVVPKIQTSFLIADDEVSQFKVEEESSSQSSAQSDGCLCHHSFVFNKKKREANEEESTGIQKPRGSPKDSESATNGAGDL